MLVQVNAYSDVDPRKLMDLYAEGNLENAEEFYPDIDKDEAVKKVEADFLRYLEQDFFQSTNPSYWILEENGQWVSALRLNRLQLDLYYLQALETRPDSRRKGYAARLLNEVCDALKQEGPFRLCDCVGKWNKPSLQTHLKCGFEIVSEAGYDYLSGEASERNYGMCYFFEP